MTFRITIKHLEYRLERMNDLMGESRKPYYRDENGKFKGNAGTFTLDIANGGYAVNRICNEGMGASTVIPRGTKRETYDAMMAFEAGAIAAMEKGATA